MKKFSHTLISLIFVSFLIFSVSFGAIMYYSLHEVQRTSLVNLEQRLRSDFDLMVKQQVQAAHSVLMTYETRIKQKELSLEEGKKLAANTLRQMKYGKDGYFWADTYEGVNVVFLGRDAEGKSRIDATDANGVKFIADIIKNGRHQEGGYTNYSFPKADQPDTPLPKRSYSLAFEPFQWVIGTGNYTNDIDEIVQLERTKMDNHQNKMLLISFGVMISLTVLLMFVTYWFGHRAVKPLELATDVVETMAAGDFTARLPALYLIRRDEIGKMAVAVNQVSQYLQHIIAEVKRRMVDSTTSIQEVNGNLANLRREIGDVASATEKIAASNEDTAVATQRLKITAEQIVSAADELATQSELGAGVVTTINERAHHLRVEVVDSQREAQHIFAQSSEQLQRAIEEVQAVEQISNLSDAILAITAQTRLLALNASIEAARAGEVGKGFSVVAAEIQKLSTSSEETVSQIQEVIHIVKQSVQHLATSSQALLNFVETEVKQDYETMLVATERYSDDAMTVDHLVQQTKRSSETLLSLVAQMMHAIGKISEDTTAGADAAMNIAERTDHVLANAQHIYTMAEAVQQHSSSLYEMVEKYRVEE